MARTFYIKTYGCQMNERDSEALRASLSKSVVPVTAEVLRHVLRQELPAYLVASGEATAKARPVVKRHRRLVK